MKYARTLLWILGCWVLNSQAWADEPSFELDPDFVYFSGDNSSLLNLKFYPRVKAEYEKVFLNIHKGLETPAEGLILMTLAYGLGEEAELQKLGKFVLKRDFRKDEARLLLASAAANRSQPDLAEFYLDQIADKSLENGVANLRGVVAFQQKRPDLAVQILQKGLRNDPNNYAIAMNLGLVMMDMQMYAAAEKHFSNVVNKHPNGYDAKLQFAIAVAARGNKPKALEILSNMKNMFPSSDFLQKTISVISKSKPLKK
jgi:tetratricopeptide (TPR) repeat protein